MALDLVAYPFIFLALYFEVFMLLTFLSRPARERRERPAAVATPKVAMIVPCWNEETTVGGTVESLLALEYPKDKLRIILVNDGSTDGTQAAMDKYKDNPQVTIIHKENGGKHTAINAGIAIATDAEFIGCLDADSFVAPDALREIVACFGDKKVAAATPAMSVFKPKNILEHMQNIEYIYGIALRHILSAVNGIYVTPGPFSLYRKSVIDQLGGFRHAYQAEDMEMALRIQRAGYEIENAPRARVYSKAPHTVYKLIKQRTRWTTGFLRNVTYDYRDLVGNPRYGTLGLMILPLGIIAVTAGILLFFLIIGTFIQQLVRTYTITSGVPLSYTLTPHLSFKWFYIPISFIALISVLALVLSVTFMVIGKRISNTPGKVVVGIIAYAIVYGFIAPFWLMRSVYDLISGKRRSWR